MASAATSADFDYVVVGSGAGGGPLAANLAEAGMRVLLLEAGGSDENLHYQVPCFHGEASEDEALRWDFFVRHYTSDVQSTRDSKFVTERGGVLYPRAGTLGGCTAHNAMITIYGSGGDWDAIASDTGDDSWGNSRMRAYFERLEACGYVGRPGRLASLAYRLPLLSRILANPRHGYDGWLHTQIADAKLALGDTELVGTVLGAAQSALSESLGRALQAHESLASYVDPNDWSTQRVGLEGLWFTPLATAAGQRNGSRERVNAAAAAHPENLVVRTHALATRILLGDDATAIGVEFVDAAHAYRADPRADIAAPLPSPEEVLVRREVIVCGGAFNSPQLLQLSGIGPRALLEDLGIDVHVERPGVGENLQDRYEVGVINELPMDMRLLQGCTFEPPVPGDEPDKCFRAWRDGKGVYTTNGVVVSIVRKSLPHLPAPDLFIFGLPASFRGYYPGYSKELERHRSHFTWAILKAHTRNTAGSVRLRSADPRVPPEINFRYFDEGNDDLGEDLDAVVAGVEFVRHMMRDHLPFDAREVLPGDAVDDDDELRTFVRDNAWGHHASCTCKMGRPDDPAAVVDSRFRVLGTRNLRVVDASVFPRIPGFFIVTPTYMISEKASDVILADAGASVPSRRHAGVS